jgi:SNF2 family DNA or RNA helicase
MFNALNMVAPHVFYSWHKYANTYTNRKSGYRGSITYTGVRNAEQLNELLRSTCMIRRKKQDVLTQLPPKQYFMVPLDITNRSEYMKMEQGVIESIDEGTSELEAGARFEKLRQLAVEGRMVATLEWIEEFLAAGRKLIVMAVHRKTVEMLHKHFPLISVYVYGGVTDAHRQDAVDRFQKDDKVRLFIGNIQAAGVGLTLTAASDVAFMELPWTPGELGQAQDRAHRIGQTRQVSIWYIVSSDTVDEEIAAILSRKQRELEQLLDGKVDADTSTVSELIRKYKKGTRV